MTATTLPRPIHVCLISGQLLPNLIPVLMEQPERVHLVVSADMSTESARFQKLLSVRGIAFTVHDRAPSTDLPRLLDYATKLACTLEGENPEQPIVLNATGGTKLMALAFVEVFRELRNAAIIVYTDTEHNRIESLSDRARPTRPMNGVVDIETYLAVYGLTPRRSASDDEAWRERALARKPLSKWLARQAGKIGDFLGALNGLVNGKEGALGEGDILVRPTQAFRTGPPRNRWREAMEEISRFGLVDWQGLKRRPY